MRYFQVTSYVTVKNEELVLNEYVKVPNQKVDQFLKETLELDLYDDQVTLRECVVAKGKWECPVGDFVITEHMDEKKFNRLQNSRSSKTKK
ncbi:MULTISPECIES: hypothetical protein [unclassified Exiguobacterium]|jgi:hypothetical protein|uniref:hypothetical protein n=1 Tax=unclassified Exiguobacterium TaxID=2644629 RepID=UPI001BE75925|nr:MULTISPECIES: hypothetical protein [unclassified Exiguobacterium]MDE0563602.1 hypothetical protein [Exiguobacterium sp. B2(2022)]